MKKILVYAFESFGQKEKMSFLGEVVVVKKLKMDAERICSTLLIGQHDFVLGVARSKWWSRFEPVAVNNIHGHKISKEGAGELDLFVPSPTIFPKSQRTTRTFCNYSMYKIAEFIKRNNLKTKLMFVHLKEKDIDKMKVLNVELLDGFPSSRE